MRELRAAIDIQATPGRVWEILTDFPAYPDWNPFITSICGRVHPRLDARSAHRTARRQAKDLQAQGARRGAWA
jgi:uncharacterized protein YndB with AHSA1/START domain